MSDDRTLLEHQMQRLELRPFTLDGFHRQRSRKQRNRRIGSAVVALVIAAVAIGGLLRAISSEQVPAEEPAPTPADLGIFEPVAGKIVYYADSSLWAVDPNAPSPLSTLVRLDPEGTADADRFALFTIPLGWSSDGTKLLFLREVPTDDTFPHPRYLYILHADGTETQVTPEPVGGAAISPDGSRVVLAADGGGLYVVDAEGGQPVQIADEGESPTFSPDGTQIAYLSESGQAGLEHVWVANADGTDAHEILTDEALVMGMSKLTWSPAGDRIAMENQQEGHVAIYTFAPDGSNFTEVITGGFNHSWSPDGSQIAYGLPGRDGVSLADADGSNLREFGFAASGPWHPGAPVEEPAPTPTPTSVVAQGPGALAYGVDGDVFLADADGTNAIKIADGVPVDGPEECAPGEERAEYIVFGTAWSPDGRYLAYWDRGCPWQVRDDPEDPWGIVRIADAAGDLVASFPGQGWQISWSPDSTRVAVMDVWEGDATIGVYGLDGVRVAALTVPASLTPSGDYSPVWSRDGSSILLRGVQVPLDGEAPTPFPIGDTWFGVYSPDGSRVAYEDRGSLVVERADGPDAPAPGGPLELWSVAWSPNGELVAYDADERELLVSDVATGADTSLTAVPASQRLGVLEFSPDGERILFTRTDIDSGAISLWSIGADGSDLRRLVDAIDWADLRPHG